MRATITDKDGAEVRLYKLTDQHGLTIGGTEWGPGVTHCLTPSDPGDFRQCVRPLRDKLYIYAYPSLEIALLIHPGNYGNAGESPRLWEAAGIVVHSFWHEVECSRLTTIRELSLPSWYRDRRSEVAKRFAQLCVMAAAALDSGTGVVLGHIQCAAEFARRASFSPDNPGWAASAANAAFATSFAAEAAGFAIDFAALAKQAIGGADVL